MKKQNSIQVYQRLLALLNLDKTEIKQIYIYSIFYGILSLMLPIGIQAAIQFIQAGKSSTSFYVIVFLVLLSIVIAGYVQLMQVRIVENLQQKIYVRYAFDFSYRLSNVDFTKHKELNPIELSNRFFETISLQKGLPKILIDLIGAILQIAFGLLLLSFYHPVFIAFSLIIITLLVLSFRYSGRKGIAYGLLESKYKYKTAYWIQEITRRKNVIQHVDHQFVLNKSDEIISGYIKNRELKFKVIWNQFIQLIGFKLLLILCFFMIGSYLVFSGKMNLGQFVASEIIIILLISSVEKVILSLETVYELFASIEKIEQVIDLPLREYKESASKEWLKSNDVSISFHELEAEMIPFEKESKIHLDYELNIVGHTTIFSENSLHHKTIINVLTRNAKIKEGFIHLNKLPFKFISNEDYFSKVYYLNHLNSIFNGSIKRNILLGKEISLEEWDEIIAKTNLKDQTIFLEEGFDKVISETDFLTNEFIIRIIIARILFLKPKIILDNYFINNLIQHDYQDLIQLLFDENQPWHIISFNSDRSIEHLFSQKYKIDQNSKEGIIKLN